MRYKIEAIRSEVHKNETSWWTKRKYKLFGWLGSRKRANLRLPGSWNSIQHVKGPITIQGRACLRVTKGRDFKKSDINLVFWEQHIWWFKFSWGGTGAQKYRFWNPFQVPVQDGGLRTSLCLPSPFSPNPVEIIVKKVQDESPTIVRRTDPLQGGLELVKSIAQS